MCDRKGTLGRSKCESYLRLFGGGNLGGVCVAVLALVFYIGPSHADGQSSRPDEPPFVYIMNENGVPQSAEQVRIPDGLIDAVAQAEVALQLDDNIGKGALIYRVRSSDGRPFEATTERHYLTPGHVGYIPKRLKAGEPAIEVMGHGQVFELRVIAPGYDTFTRRAILRRDQIILWDDIILEPLSPTATATIRGIVRFEDNADPNGMLIQVDGDPSGFVAADGRFVASGLRSGEIRVSTLKQGYYGLFSTVEVKRGGTATCELRGYLERAARVRWVFQPDETRNLMDNVQSGIATLSPTRLHRVSFEGGFRQVRDKSDFFIEQKDDKLTIVNCDQTGPIGPGFIHVKDSLFDQITEAPEGAYWYVKHEIQPGFIFVFRCYDGKHFAKMEILQVGTAAEIGDLTGGD